MTDFYTQWWPYTIHIKRRDNDFWANAIFEYRWDNCRRQLWMDFPQFQLERQMSANMQQLVNDANERRMRLMYNKFCEYEYMNTNEDDYFQFWQAIYREIMRKRLESYPTIKSVVEVKKEQPKLEPEIQEAINITNEAIKAQKEIVEKISYINKLRNDYYAKYWTFIEKTLAYLQLK